MNSLNEIVRSCCWNLVEKFQISTPTTTSTTQNNRLFNVEFKQGLPRTKRRCSHPPNFKDYHGLRGVRYPKRLVNSVARHPNNPVRRVDHQGHRVAIAPCHFAIHEKILQFLPAAEPDRRKTVAWTPISHAQRSQAEVAADNRRAGLDAAAAHDCTVSPSRRLGRDNPVR